MQIAAAYVRVSTDMQTEYSPDSQLRLIREYAKSNAMILPEDFIYIEPGVSGKYANKRPQFQRMITAAKKKAFEAVLVYNTSRFARNHEESIVYKSMLKRDCGVDVISITQPPVDRKTDMLTNAIYSVMDEWYSLDLAVNVKRGMTEKALRGEHQGCAPYGYRAPGDKKPLEIIEEEAVIVRMIFDIYVNEGLSTWGVGRRITGMGHRTRRGKPFSSKTIEYILTNAAYKGVLLWNRMSNKYTKNEKEDWVRSNGAHDPIIPATIYDKAQEKYDAAKRKERKNERPVETHKHWLSTILKCNDCGSSLTYRARKYPFFLCGGYVKGVCNKRNAISEKRVVSVVRGIIESVKNNVYDIRIDRIVRTNNMGNKLDDIKKQIINLDKRLKRVKDAFESGIDTIEEYAGNKKRLETERKELEQELTGIETPQFNENVLEEIAESAKNVYCKLFEPELTTPEKLAVTRTLINKIMYDKEKDMFDVFFNA